MSDPIVVVEYDPQWPSEFARLRDRAQAAVGEVARSIEHVGSTAVPGLAAKPVIDLVVVVESEDDVPEAIRRLEAVGYIARGDLGVPGREAFSWPEGEARHHLYVSPETSGELRAQLRFRDRLCTDPVLAREYEALKRDLAERYRDDRPATQTRRPTSSRRYCDRTPLSLPVDAHCNVRRALEPYSLSQTELGHAVVANANPGPSRRPPKFHSA